MFNMNPYLLNYLIINTLFVIVIGAVIALGIISLVLHKETKKYDLKGVKTPVGKFPTAMILSAIILPLVHLAYHTGLMVFFLIKAKAAEDAAMTEYVAIYLIVYFAEAILLALLFVLIRNVYIQKKKLKEAKRLKIIADYEAQESGAKNE